MDRIIWRPCTAHSSSCNNSTGPNTWFCNLSSKFEQRQARSLKKAATLLAFIYLRRIWIELASKITRLRTPIYYPKSLCSSLPLLSSRPSLPFRLPVYLPLYAVVPRLSHLSSLLVHSFCGRTTFTAVRSQTSGSQTSPPLKFGAVARAPPTRTAFSSSRPSSSVPRTSRL